MALWDNYAFVSDLNDTCEDVKKLNFNDESKTKIRGSILGKNARPNLKSKN